MDFKDPAVLPYFVCSILLEAYTSAPTHPSLLTLALGLLCPLSCEMFSPCLSGKYFRIQHGMENTTEDLQLLFLIQMKDG